MVEVNWTMLAYLFIGLFALAGFYKGWWKEAITTIFLTILVFLLQVPGVAGAIIEFINFIIAVIWGLFSESIRLIFGDVLEAGFGIEAGVNPPQIDPSSSQTWLIILIIFLGMAILVSRWWLPNMGRVIMPYQVYYVTCGGRILGAILGGINGWLIISLVLAYLEGSQLPGGSGTATTANEVIVQAVEVPSTTLTDSYLPWMLMGSGVLLFIIALRSRAVILEEKGFRKIEYHPPLGYQKIDVTVE